MNEGKVWLVGAGTGDSSLMTCKGLEVLNQAQVVVYDALVSLEILAKIPKDAEKINAGKRSSHHILEQEEINQLLLEKAKLGKRVVRLKGGDPFVFGRGAEELELLVKEKVPFEVVPGITSSIAVPAYFGIPVTHRNLVSSLHIYTGHKKGTEQLALDYEAMVRAKGTLVFLMGVKALPEIVKGLMDAGMKADMPAAVIQNGTTYAQKGVSASLEDLEEKVKEAKIGTPAIILVGEVCKFHEVFSFIEKKPLFGVQMINTRPQGKKSVLTEICKDLGAQVVEIPSIQTQIEANGKELLKTSSLWKEDAGEPGRWICFQSPQGVEYFWNEMLAMQKDIRFLAAKQVKFACIGPATKKALEGKGILCDLMPEQYHAQALGELLVKKLEKHEKVYVIDSLQSKKDLVKVLREEGIWYEEIPIYTTEKDCMDIWLRTHVSDALSNGQISYITFTSASCVEGFATQLPDVDYDSLRAVCIGQQTEKKAKEYGFQTITARNATMQSMAECMIEDWKKEGKKTC